MATETKEKEITAEDQRSREEKARRILAKLDGERSKLEEENQRLRKENTI